MEQFVITANTTAPVRPNSIDYGQHALRTLEGSWQPATAPVPTGSFAVSLRQPLGRLAFYFLEPTSDDGLTTWNVLDDLLKDARVFPITRKR